MQIFYYFLDAFIIDLLFEYIINGTLADNHYGHLVSRLSVQGCRLPHRQLPLQVDSGDAG